MGNVAEAETRLAEARQAVLDALESVTDDVKSNWAAWANNTVRSLASAQPDHTTRLGSGLSEVKASVQQSINATLDQVGQVIAAELPPEKWADRSAKIQADLQVMLETLSANLWQIMREAGYQVRGLGPWTPARPGFPVNVSNIIGIDVQNNLFRAVRSFQQATDALEVAREDEAKNRAADAWDQA